MATFLQLTQILVAVILVVIILIQVKGTTGVFGTQASVFRTRRGLEKTLFQLTIVLVVVFLIISFLSVIFGARGPSPGG